MAKFSLFLWACLAFFAADATERETVTPIEKVVQLLKKLSAQIAEEGKKEAAEYDKYACFCKEQADDKLYAIETSNKKIDTLKAKEDELKKTIGALNQDISDLSKKVSGLADDIKKETDARKAEFDTYQKNAKDLNDAVSACERAIEAMKDSKDDIVDGKVDLAQITASSPLVAAALVGIKTGKQEPAAFEYRSNDIIATLESLLAKFKQGKADLDSAEMSSKSASQLKTQDMSNQKTFAEKEKSEKEETVETLSETLADTTSERTEETKAKDADDEFLKVLTAECEQKAKDFDQRSQTRSSEITTITKALTDLEEKAVGNYKANKKLTDLQTKKAVKIASYKAPSFLQLRGSPNKASLLAKSSGAGQLAAAERVLDMLRTRTKASQSPVLASLTMKLALIQNEANGIDHFVKVRQIIKDLLQKLDEDAKSEASTKAYCDTNMKKQVEARDSAKLTIEEKGASITTAKADEAATAQDIADLEAGIAKNMKGLKEAQELRAEEKAANDLSISMSDEGKASVEYALTILKEFYSDAKKSFIQKAAYTPPKADRSGKTVGDLAPDTFSGKYHGNQDASTGIIGILEVIVADFTRTKAAVEKADEESKKAYEEYEKTTTEDNDAKKKELKTKEEKLSNLKDSLVTLKDEKNDAEKELETAETTLEDLKKMCVEGEESYAERVAKRKEEIDALKEALTILENWKS